MGLNALGCRLVLDLDLVVRFGFDNVGLVASFAGLLVLGLLWLAVGVVSCLWVGCHFWVAGVGGVLLEYESAVGCVLSAFFW